MLLAVDTSEQTCSAAILDGPTVLAQRCENIGRGHAERLLPLIEEIMQEAGCVFADLNRLAVTTGPGTFTGLRVGLSVVRGLALAQHIPCIGLSGLQVLAAQRVALYARLGAVDANSNPQTVHAVITGRAGQAFLQSFCGTDSQGLPVAVSEAAGLDADIIARAIAKNPGCVVGSGRALLATAGHAAVLDDAGTAVVCIDAVTLGLLAHKLEPALFPPEPLYLRVADAKKAVPLLLIDPAE